MQMSLAKLGDLKTRYESMQKRIATVKADAQEKVMIVVQTAEVGTSAFAMGLINGRWNRPEVVGVPVDALAGMLFHTAGFLVDNDAGHHMHNLGDGALASYVAGLGLGVGAKMRMEALNPSGQLPA